MSALLIGLLVAAGAGVTVYEIQVDGDAAAVAPVLAKRLGAHGARGELMVAPGRLWLVADEAPEQLGLSLAAGRLRFMPASKAPGPDTTPLVEAGPPERTWHVRTQGAMQPTLTQVKAGRDQYTGSPHVSATFDAAGKAEFHALTKGLVDQHLAIVIDDAVVSAPVVREPIPGGRVMITLGGGPKALAEAERLAARLRGGPLPAKVTLLRTQAATRAEADGITTVSGTPLRYPTPKRWHPAACALSQRDDCQVLVVTPR